jgi:hypothetical protein
VERKENIYIILHHPPELSLGSLTVKATLAASVNASLTPRFFIAEHSVAHISFLKKSKLLQVLLTQVSQRFYPLSDFKALLVLNHRPLWFIAAILFILM